MIRTFDVIIVGNGVLGTALAIRLHEADERLKIALLGPVARPLAASRAAGAMLGAFAEVTTGSLDSRAGRDKLAVAVSAEDMWPDWLQLLHARAPADKHVTIGRGTFVIHNCKAGRIEDENYRAIIACAREHEVRCEQHDPGDIPGYAPDSQGRALEAVFLPDEGFIDSGGLLELMDANLTARNITRIDARAAALEVEAGRMAGVRLDSGESVAGRHVVLAAGAFSQKILASVPDIAAQIPPIIAGEGNSVVLAQSPRTIQHVIRTPNRAFACGLHVVPKQSADLLYVGATNDVEWEPVEGVKAMNMHFLLECALEQIDQRLYESRLVNWWCGNRPISADTFPLMGPTSVEGLSLMTGTYRDGLHCSPFYARYLARSILGQDIEWNNPFLPERLPIQTHTREQMVEQTVQHYDSVPPEHNMRFSTIGWHKTIHRWVRGAIEQFYEEMTPYVPPLEFMTLMNCIHDPVRRQQMLNTIRQYYVRVNRAHH